MRKTYLAVTESENGKNFSYVIGIGENENVFSALSRYKNLESGHIFPTKKKAQEVADFWNECYKNNGTYKFV